MFPQAHQCVPFRRLSISCPSDSHDFLAGVFRRSRLSFMKMTTDINFLAGIDQIHVSKDNGRRYFSNVEDLWLLMIHPDDDVTQRFLAIEGTLFSVSTLCKALSVCFHSSKLKRIHSQIPNIKIQDNRQE